MGTHVTGVALAKTATLIVVNPSGNRVRVPVEPIPFNIGRQADNHLVIRDNRASRNHARVTFEEGEYYIEDLKSSHGVFVNGARVQRQRLYNSDRVEFGFPDSYSLIFTLEEDEIHRLLNQFSTPRAASGATGNLAKLRALVDVARALQNSLSTDDVLAAVVDAALAFTGFERGFLLLEKGEGLEISVARDRHGRPVAKSELKVSVKALQRALRQRRELLAMSFDPAETAGFAGDATLAEDELRSVVCVPIVRVRGNSSEETQMITSKSDTVGVIYLDSRQTAVDLSHGNRELLQTLALEASTILENARLLAEERVKQRMEEELNIAREIQASLLPRRLPETGWFRVAGWSVPSYQVGGDYYDIKQINAELWSLVVTDVSGKGVSSAILAALLQGAFVLASEGTLEIERMMERVNHFLNDRTEGEKYATAFYCTIAADGLLRWANAGHVTPYLVRRSGDMQALNTTGMPLGMLPMASFAVESERLAPGDKIIAYSDGLSEAQNGDGRFFDAARMKELIRAHAAEDYRELHEALREEVEQFTRDAVQTDDITLVVMEYAGS
jgi:serine phosphatase RsbU (regulator of sigma subunit)/pSer/pThr/pTyr-binding forkhead associated (FHA) protein